MLAALAALEAQLQPTTPGASNNNGDDPLISRMKTQAVLVKQPQDALVAVVHFMMQEAGFVHTDNTHKDTSLFLPPHWDKHSDQGMFVFQYSHPYAPATTYTLKVPNLPSMADSDSLRLPDRRPVPAPPLYPNVGGGDAFPEFLGPPNPILGRRDPGMEVGPGHPLFGGQVGGYGPVPGARFDPYGPVGPSHLFRPQPGRQPRGPPLFGG
ncbi:hypothetical protein DYB28_011496 [Aphanomyces astaci]|uniref:PI31 proteasome regulator N-terminal domain-containing protein n=1 Tax=Aphanomyces astaci TaxID=112090 RepID=A0A397EBC6_APHAT|nr:hypothetical protein DYB38_010714 [Aphanomyces astaci]RHY78629.1 hypothetical protein DYB30_013405 [Aphanomyces astaci]RLO13950.1 hypothetical protein DYB28_011496 [Aphanomyces astaci]